MGDGWNYEEEGYDAETGNTPRSRPFVSVSVSVSVSVTASRFLPAYEQG